MYATTSVAAPDLSLKEGDNVERVECRAVVSGDFKGEYVPAGNSRKRYLVDAEISVRRSRRTVVEKLAVQRHAVEG